MIEPGRSHGTEVIAVVQGDSAFVRRQTKTEWESPVSVIWQETHPARAASVGRKIFVS
jgi:hypothetical protein